MEPTLIYLAIACTALAGLFYYFGFIRRDKPVYWISQSSFIALVFLVIPVLVVVLWQQEGALERLSERGITPHPAIDGSVGVTAGQGAQPVWVFETLSDSRVDLSFYADESNRKGWAIRQMNEMMVIMSKDEMIMTIMTTNSSRDNHISYTLRDESQ